MWGQSRADSLPPNTESSYQQHAIAMTTPQVLECGNKTPAEIFIKIISYQMSGLEV